MKAAIVPQYPDTLGKGKLFEFDGYNPTNAYGADRHAFARLHKEFRDAGDELYTLDQVDIQQMDVVLFVDLTYTVLERCLEMDDPPNLAYIMREPPSVRPYNASSEINRYAGLFDIAFTWNGSLSKGRDNFVEYNIPQLVSSPSSKAPTFDDRNLLVNISSRKYSSHPEELYSAREHIIQYYDKHHPEKFDLFGLYWNQLPRLQDVYHHCVFNPSRYTTYGGVVDDKIQVYKNYNFVICFENMTGIDGYVTEKLFDCMRAGCVPIYWGAENIGDYVPKDVFIDFREFGSPQALHEYISEIDKDTYNDYLYAANAFLEGSPEWLTASKYARTIHRNCIEIDQRGRGNLLPPELKEEISRHAKIEKVQSDELNSRQSIRTLLNLLRTEPSMILEHPGTLKGVFGGFFKR